MSFTDSILAAAVAELSFAARRRILAVYTQRRHGMRNSETPGHATWYPIHLRDEVAAAAALGLPAPVTDAHAAELRTRVKRVRSLGAPPLEPGPVAGYEAGTVAEEGDYKDIDLGEDGDGWRD